MINLLDKRFGSLLVKGLVKTDYWGTIWNCLCDCGKETIARGTNLRRGLKSDCGCRRIESLAGKVFGRLTALSFKSKNKYTWLCRCICGKKVIVSSGHLKNGHTQSCGCFNKARIRETKVRNLEGLKFNHLLCLKLENSRKKLQQAHWECKCDCGKTCVLPSFSITSGNTTSCGCIKKNQKKENHPRWNKKISLEERGTGKRKYNTEEHRHWRERVFERDNYICQISGQVGGQIVAHHIESWNTNKELRFDVKNGITLSRKLHILFHRKYGYGGNTKKQFQEFKIKWTHLI